MPNNQDLNFEFLLINFREKSEIRSMVNLFKKMVRDPRGLEHFLRNHHGEPIRTDEEIQFRRGLDLLLGFYSAVAAALLCNYVSVDIVESFSETDTQIITNPSVVKYYEAYYPLVLPTILQFSISFPEFRQVIQSIASRSTITTNEFELFLNLFRSRLEDEDINNMLLFLDDGFFYDWQQNVGISVDRFVLALENPVVYRSTSDNFRHSAYLSQIFLGFSKFMNYLNIYRNKLEPHTKRPYQAATIWLLETYWFSRLNFRLGDTIKNGLNNLNEAIFRKDYFRWEEQSDADMIEDWVSQSFYMINETYESINFLRDPQLSTPLLDIIRDNIRANF